jgi:hypothetical protein
MSNSFYEDTLLKEEFNLVGKLQQDTEFSKYVVVFYEDRILGEQRSVSVAPNGSRYPEKYIVQYRMPVYVSPGQLRTDWHGVATMELSERVLINKHAHQGPHVTFDSNFEPYNNHVLKTSICSGNAWAVAKENGLWHFIISLGALINQDEFVCAEGWHYNGGAYDYWVSRGRRPVTDIRWPLNLLSQPEIFITPVSKGQINIVPTTNQKSAIAVTPKGSQSNSLNIVAKTPEKQNTAINIVPKAKSRSPEIKITEKKK